MILSDSRVTVEWDWVLFGGRGQVLHAPKEWDDDYYDAYDEEGLTHCGRRGYICIPGVFTRMGAMRCARCCTVTGMPRGKGSPKNSDLCRPIVEERLQTLRRI